VRYNLHDCLNLAATSVFRLELHPHCGTDSSELAALLRVWCGSPFFGRVPPNAELEIGLIPHVSDTNATDDQLIPVRFRYSARLFLEGNSPFLGSTKVSESRLPLVDLYIGGALGQDSEPYGLYSLFEKYDSLPHRLVLAGGVTLQGPLSVLIHIILLSWELKILGIDTDALRADLTDSRTVTDEESLHILLPTRFGLQLRQSLVGDAGCSIAVSRHYYGLLHAMLPEVTRWTAPGPQADRTQNFSESTHSRRNYQRYKLSSQSRLVLGSIMGQSERWLPTNLQRLAAFILFSIPLRRRSSSVTILYSQKPVDYNTWCKIQDAVEIVRDSTK